MNKPICKFCRSKNIIRKGKGRGRFGLNQIYLCRNCKRKFVDKYSYALGLSFRTRIPLWKFRCAWFDEENYFEFKPNEVKIKW